MPDEIYTPIVEPRTTNVDLVSRVRSNIYEVSGGEEHRTDAEIRVWLNDALQDYMARLAVLPEEIIDGMFPGLLVHVTVTSFPWPVPTNFAKLISVHVTHLVGGESTTDMAFFFTSSQSYMTLRQTGSLGAWAQFQNNATGTAPVIAAGPEATAGLVKYRRNPGDLIAPGQPVDIDTDHEEAIVNRATAFALQKINDEEADWYLQQYEKRIQAEISKYQQLQKVKDVT